MGFDNYNVQKNLLNKPFFISERTNKMPAFQICVPPLKKNPGYSPGKDYKEPSEVGDIDF